MQGHAPAAVFERYDKLLREKALENLSECISCANEICTYGGIVDARFVGYFSRKRCKTSTCTTCRITVHPGLTHEENMAIIEDPEKANQDKKHLEDERLSDTLVLEKTKACPNVECGVRIEKNGGCDHMVCFHPHAYVVGGVSGPDADSFLELQTLRSRLLLDTGQGMRHLPNILRHYNVTPNTRSVA